MAVSVFRRGAARREIAAKIDTSPPKPRETSLLQKHMEAQKRKAGADTVSRKKKGKQRPSWRLFTTSDCRLISGTDIKEGTSNYFIQAAKAFHHFHIDESAKNFSYDYSQKTPLDIAVEQRKAKAIAKYEATLPMRRNYDRDGVLPPGGRKLRSVGNWAADSRCIMNLHHQERDHGVPLMTRTMHGEFYNIQPVLPPKKPNFVEKNRRNIAVASEVMHVARPSVLRIPPSSPSRGVSEKTSSVLPSHVRTALQRSIAISSACQGGKSL